MTAAAKKKPIAAVKEGPQLVHQFGLGFVPQWTEMHRRLFCARSGRGTVSRYEHRRWIIEHLWSNEVYDHSWRYEDGTVGMNPWSARRLKSTCENVFNIWMGPGGSAKTTDAAASALEYWLESPNETAVIVASTTKDMLRRRIWNEIARLWHALPTDMFGLGQLTPKGDMLDTQCMIRWQPNDMKNGIFGLAVADGPVEEAINNLVGIHTKRVWLILDEMQGVREAIMGALPNMVKNPESRFLGMGNPTSLQSMLCKYAEPKGGWNAVVRGETEDWEINEGPYIGSAEANFFDGRKSPAVMNPEWGARNPWMISASQVQKHIETKGMNSPEVWTQTIGWPPPLGTDNTVLDPAIIEKFRCHDRAYWTSDYTQGASLDPAFVEGGDRKILQFFRKGFVNDDLGSRWVIEFGEWLEVPIDSGSNDPVEYQIVRYVRERCESKGITAGNVATDSTGIGRGLLSVFQQEWGPVVGVEFGGKPSDMVVDGEGKRAHEVYDRRSSELNIMVRTFAVANGIRGLSKEAAGEFTNRMTSYTGKYRVETKKEYKKRNGKSCDASDAACIGLELARQQGAVPGAAVAPRARSVDVQRKLIEADRQFDESNYARDEDWAGFAAGL